MKPVKLLAGLEAQVVQAVKQQQGLVPESCLPTISQLYHLAMQDTVQTNMKLTCVMHNTACVKIVRLHLEHGTQYMARLQRCMIGSHRYSRWQRLDDVCM